MERRAQTESGGYVRPYQGLGIPHRDTAAHGPASIAARGIGECACGGCASRWAYHSRRCHDHTFDTCTGLNNHSSKQHGYYYSLKGDCFVLLRENSVCACMPPPATAHYYGGAKGGGQHSRGRVRHAPGRIWPPYPRGVPPIHYLRDADRQIVMPQAVRSSIVNAWLQARK